MTELSNLIATFEQLWPVGGAESWDAPGLISGNPEMQVSKVLLTVDITAELVSEAVGRYDLVLAHHPFLLRGVTLVGENTAKGGVLAKSIRSNLALYSAHTNADIVYRGVSDILASTLGVIDAVPLVVAAAGSEVGHGRIGKLATPMPLGEFARVIAKSLPATATGVRVAGDYMQLVETVAVCGGAGDSFIAAAGNAGADVYVTADLRHHVVQEARETARLATHPLALVDVSHWASEWLWLAAAAEQLAAAHPSVRFDVSDLRTDPFDFVITQ